MIRDLQPYYLAKLRLIHASQEKFDADFPKLDSPLYVNQFVSVQNGKLIAAGLHKVTYETFVLVDPNARPQEKWTALGELNGALSTRAYQQGLDETFASVQRSIGFDKRLRQLGWSEDRPGWQLWSLKTNEVSGSPSD